MVGERHPACGRLVFAALSFWIHGHADTLARPGGLSSPASLASSFSSSSYSSPLGGHAHLTAQAALAGAQERVLAGWRLAFDEGVRVANVSRGRKPTQAPPQARQFHLRKVRAKASRPQFSQCRRCLCDARLELSSHCEAEDSALPPLEGWRCLRDMACCDCEACREAWPVAEYHRASDTDRDCEATCARCEGGEAYTLADVQLMHPRPTALEEWTGRISRSTEFAWVSEACGGAQSGGAAGTAVVIARDGGRLANFTVRGLACVAEAAVSARTGYCACGEADEAGCIAFRAALQSPALSIAPAAKLESLLAGSPPGRFCEDADSVGFFSHPDLDPLFRRTAARLVSSWAAFRFQRLATAPQMSPSGRAALSGSSASLKPLGGPVAAFEETELGPLAAQLLEARVEQINSLDAELRADLESVKSRIMLWTTTAIGVTASCVEAYRNCGMDGRCLPMLYKMLSPKGAVLPDQVVEAMGACQSNGTTSRALDIVVACRGLPEDATASIRSALQAIGPSCMNAKAAAQDLKIKLLPSLLLSLAPAEAPLLPALDSPQNTAGGCSTVLWRCALEPGCGPAADALIQTSGSTSEMLKELLGACGKRKALLALLEVSAECPGLLPQTEMRRIRKAAALVPKEQLCPKMRELTDVLVVMFKPLPSMDCLAARAACEKEPGCRVARNDALNTTVAEALHLCEDKSALLLSLRAAEACWRGSVQLGKGLGVVLDATQVLASAATALQPIPEAELCEHTRALEGELLPKLSGGLRQNPEVDTPSACLAAGALCEGRVLCRAWLSQATLPPPMGMRTGGFLDAALQLCGEDVESMLAALAVVAECPGPWPRETARTWRVSLEATHNVSGARGGTDMCIAVLQLARPAVGSVPWAGISQALATAVEMELPGLASAVVGRLITAFDVAPADRQLNAVEIQALYLVAQASAGSDDGLLGGAAALRGLERAIDIVGGSVNHRLLAPKALEAILVPALQLRLGGAADKGTALPTGIL
eukprot:CAMPEP_0180567836 /NCGR_PEP_ID=MMETSP1037_2-20121125/6816_1 /TAXON_ID=632150 /ORGANISM="Azadinium spinosum, Strain 3D9" /LENGTH=1000 /DNA_ID=CAMNT_0022584949 /DNA_START=54 /DNA_END=3056 /DNA_ORIENTATION=-